MNILKMHEQVIQDNKILLLINKLQKEADEKKQDEIKKQIIALNGKFNAKEIGRVG